MKQRMTALILTLALSLGLFVTGASAAGFSRGKTYTPGQFTDVADSAWYATSVKDCYELGLMSGNSDTTFNPSGMFTLAEAATIAARMHDIYNGGSGTIPGAAGDWYQGAVDYCVNNGIFAAGDFDSYTRSATRAEMAAIMAAALPDDAWAAKNQVTQLPDVTAVTPGSEAIFKLYNAGVFTGSDAYGKFQPYACITRAEVAAIVARCADESQRKVLNLTPMSQEGVVLPENGSDSLKMSSGRLKFQDPNTQKYGYLDGSGNVAIPATYDYAEDFYDGYAAVSTMTSEESFQSCLIDTNGAPVIYLENALITCSKEGWGRAVTLDGSCALIRDGKFVTGFDLKSDVAKMGDNAYLVKREVGGQEKLFLLNAAGQEITSADKLSVLCNEFYTVAMKDNSVEIYDAASGVLLYSIPGSSAAEIIDGSRFIMVKEGNKYALYAGTGRVTEAVYDDIELLEDSEMVYVYYGSRRGVAGLNGEILAPGEYSYVAIINDGYISCIKDSTGYVANNTGILFQLDEPAKVSYIDDFYCLGEIGDLYNSSIAAFDRSGKTLFPDGVDANLGGWICGQYATVKYSYRDESYNRFYYFLLKGHCYGPYVNATDAQQLDSGAYIYAAQNSDGTWDCFDTSGEYKTGYASREEAYNDANSASPSEEESNTYKVLSNDIGKPYVGYGNETDGYTPVIEFYKNNMYYDEIKAIGEGYYACRFNTTWYLRHV